MGVSMGKILRCAQDDKVKCEEGALGLDSLSVMYDLDGQAIVCRIELSSRAKQMISND
jgi:hypothetical protein